MSPLARSLLALACAALLHAARAQTLCKSGTEGKYGQEFKFPLIKINASLGADVCFDMKDKHGNKDAYCQARFGDTDTYELVGLSAVACDWQVQPGLEISYDLTMICVHRKWNLEPDASLVIWEFCLPKPKP